MARALAITALAAVATWIAGTADASPHANRATGWIYSASRNPMHGTADHMACTYSTNLVRLGFPYRSQRLRLCVRERAGETNIFVDLPAGGQFYCLGTSGCTVSFKFDDQPLDDEGADTADDGSTDTLFIDREMDVLSKFLSAHQVWVEVPLYQAGDQQLHFNVSGLRWTLPPAPAPDPVAIAFARPSTSLVEQPTILQAPNRDDLARYYPDRAQRADLAGQATIACKVTAKGFLDACTVVGEVPTDQGFGDAALKMARLYKLRPLTRDGVPTDDGRITIPIDFSLPKE